MRTALRHQRGFSLIELLVSLGIVAVIGGIAVGMIRRGDGGLGAEANERLIRSSLRLARNSARASGAGALVELDPTERSLLVAPVILAGNWHFEDGNGPAGRKHDYEGQIVEEGRLGRGLQIKGSNVDLGLSQVEPRNGFRVTLWVKRADDDQEGGGLIERENTFSLGVNDEGALEASLRVGAQSEDIQLTTRPGLLVPGRWAEVELSYDRAELRILKGGVVYARRGERRFVSADPKARLLLGGDGLNAIVDNLRYWAISSGETERLGVGLDIGSPAPILVRFDGQGRLSSTHHQGALTIPLLYDEGEEEPRRGAIRVETSGVLR